MHNGPRLQELIAQYGRLRQLQGYTPQSRGQVFDDLLRDMLRCWGLSARSKVRAKGELDVVFTVGDRRYVVEAKWKNQPASTEQIAKLQKRLKQVHIGANAIFISMNGYTPEALRDVADGERLEVVLMDHTHVEAMLSGLVPPEEMMGRILDFASFEGRPYVPLRKLIGPEDNDEPSVAFGASGAMSGGLVSLSSTAVTAQVLFSVPSSDFPGATIQPGIAVDPDGRVLVTTDQGILAVDIATRGVRWAAPVSQCHRHAMVQPDGSVLFTRRHGVGRFADGEVTVVGGGLFGETGLAAHPDGTAWAFASGDTKPRLGASVSRLGQRLGDEQRHGLPNPAASAITCAWVDDKDLVTVGPEVLITTVGADKSRKHQSGQAHPTAMASLGDGTIVTVENGGALGRTQLRSGEYHHLADLDLQSASPAICAEPAGSLLIATHYGDGPQAPIAVGRISPIAPPTSAHTQAEVAASISKAHHGNTADIPLPAASSAAPVRPIQQLALDFENDEPRLPVPAPEARERSRDAHRVATGSTRMATDGPTVVDLFAGSGGMTLGFTQEGYRPVLALDIDLASAATYAANFGEENVRLGDIRQFDLIRIPNADILVAAPPSQGFSGWQTRRSDPRNSLWADFWRVAQEIRPYAFAMVAAPRFVRSSEFSALLQTIDEQSDTSYTITHELVHAADFGVPQHRQFAVIMGSRYARMPPLGWNLTPSGDHLRTVRDCLGSLESPASGANLPEVMTALLDQHVRGPFRGKELHLARHETALAHARYSQIPPGGDIRDLPADLLSPRHFRRGRQGPAGAMGRMRWDRPAPAIRTEFFKAEKGRFLHPEQDRTITHYEAALLQGFPPDYLWCGSRTEIAHQIGEATPVQLAATIARHIRQFL